MTVLFRLVILVIAASAILTDAALAHATGRGFVLLLPTEAMKLTGALAVGASFLLLAFVPHALLRAMFREWRSSGIALPRIETVMSLLSLVFWTGLVVVGLIGARDPLANPLPLTVWTFVWIALPLGCAVFGNLWAMLNPWSGLVRLISSGEPLLKLPERLGTLPALIGLIAFGWFEIVDLAPDDPARLATAVAVYSAVTVIGMLLFGEREWLRRGDFLFVFLHFIGQLAPIRFEQRVDGPATLIVSLPGAGLVNSPAPSFTDALFILCALATVSFDGLSETWWWLTQLGINVLEFPGRSAVVLPNTLGLLTASVILGGGFILCLLIGGWFAPPQKGLREIVSRLALSIIPISLAYHFAHYLTALLVNGQYALATASDPLSRGDDWLGLGTFYVTTSFLNTADTVAMIWRAQSWAIIVGHVLAVCVAHRIALDLWERPRGALIGQIPLAFLMVAYTVFGLWLLSSPTA